MVPTNSDGRTDGRTRARTDARTDGRMHIHRSVIVTTMSRSPQAGSTTSFHRHTGRQNAGSTITSRKNSNIPQQQLQSQKTSLPVGQTLECCSTEVHEVAAEQILVLEL